MNHLAELSIGFKEERMGGLFEPDLLLSDFTRKQSQVYASTSKEHALISVGSF